MEFLNHLIVDFRISPASILSPIPSRQSERRTAAQLAVKLRLLGFLHKEMTLYPFLGQANWRYARILFYRLCQFIWRRIKTQNVVLLWKSCQCEHCTSHGRDFGDSQRSREFGDKRPRPIPTWVWKNAACGYPCLVNTESGRTRAS